MKKIISLFAAVAMFATMSITSFAASATIEMSSKTVPVAEGTQDVTLDVTFTLSEETAVSIVALPFELPAGVTFGSYDTAAFAAFCDELYDDSADTTITIMDDDMEAMVSGSFSIPVTFTVDTSVAAVYNIALAAGDTMIADADGEPINDADNPPTATITVAAPAPSTTPVEIAPVTDYEKSAKFEKDGAEYYHAAFTRDITVSATNDPVKGIELKGDKEPVKVTFNTAITSEDTTVKVAINILNVPADATLGTITITPFAK